MHTSWGDVADWYNEHLEGDTDTYHHKVVLPNLMRVLSLKGGERVLDLACGQGFFTRAMAAGGAHVTGADIAPELIKKARANSPKDIVYHVAPAEDLSFAAAHEYDIVVCVLALQNIEHLRTVYQEVQRVLRPGGRFVMVLNHPAFRVPQHSSWQFDEMGNVQYRRVDGYLIPKRVEIKMHPGQAHSPVTVSFHRSLQDFFKALTGAGFAVTKLEEWISHRTSEKGPRQKAEDTARKEIPLFLMLEAVPVCC